MARISYVLLIIIFISSCKRPEQEPQFLRIDNIKVTEVKGNEALLNADAYFYNPNDVNMKLKKVDVDVIIENRKIGTINHSLKTKIPAKSEFKIPLDATFNLGDIGLLNSIISILGGKKVKVHYSGYITVSMYGFSSKIPVKYDDEVRI